MSRLIASRALVRDAIRRKQNRGIEIMVRRGRKSIVRQVKESLQAINKIGQSKKMARDKGESGIHSYKQEEHTMSDAQNFVKWCRSEHGVLSIADLTQDHYKVYIAHLAEKGVSRGHQRNVETSLRLLEKGFRKCLEREKSHQKPFEGFCTEKRLIVMKTNEGVQNRSYSDEEVQRIREQCSPEVQKSVDLMRNLGLRVEESVKVRKEHFKPDNGGWKLDIKNGQDITKGGRYRNVPVPKEFEQRLEQLLREHAEDGRLVKIQESTVRKGLNRACEKAGVEQDGRGAHGFRHTYARERFNQMAMPEQKQMMVRILENRAIGRKADYGVHDKQLYNATKEIMDKVHEELGHGKNRWELAMRYLKE